MHQAGWYWEKTGNVPVAGSVEEWESCYTMYLGFPIWHYGAPNVIHSFCKRYNLPGKRGYVFAASGGSGIGKTEEKLEPYLKGTGIADALAAHGRKSNIARPGELKAEFVDETVIGKFVMERQIHAGWYSREDKNTRCAGTQLKKHRC